MTKYYPKIKPILSETRAFFLNKSTEIYNSLPLNLHGLKTENFNKKIKAYARLNFANDQLHKQDGYYHI